MTTKEKNDQLIKAAQLLSYRKRIVFSNMYEGDLKKPSDILDDFQYDSAENKPNGLWYGFGPCWLEYLTDGYTHQGVLWTKLRVDEISNVYQLSLRRSRLCVIQTDQEFDKFVKKYSNKSGRKIYWDKVADKYDGIEIRFLPNKHNKGWYKGWDCSSGCIWNHKAVRGIKTIASWTKEWQRS